MATPKKAPARKPGAAKKPVTTQTIASPGQGKPVTFEKGGLHKSVGVPQGEKIPAKKMADAAAGKYGAKAQKQANMAQGMLAAGRKTAAKNARKGK